MTREYVKSNELQIFTILIIIDMNSSTTEIGTKFMNVRSQGEVQFVNKLLDSMKSACLRHVTAILELKALIINVKMFIPHTTYVNFWNNIVL